MRFLAGIALLAISSFPVYGQSSAAPEFPGVTQWKAAVQHSDLAALQGLYSSNPPANYMGADKKPHDISEEIGFWQKAAGFSDLNVVQRGSGDQQGLHLISLTISFKTTTPAGPRTRYVLEDQAWQQQGSAWKIVIAKHTDILKTPQPSNLDSVIYPPNVDAKAEIQEAVARAGREHKRVLLVFGADWCYDCKVLDFELHQADFAKVVAASFVVVHVDIGEGDKNSDLVAKYEIPAQHGVPVLAILDGSGKLLFSDQHREFQSARSMDPDDVMAFLEKWKP